MAECTWLPGVTQMIQGYVLHDIFSRLTVGFPALDDRDELDSALLEG